MQNFQNFFQQIGRSINQPGRTSVGKRKSSLQTTAATSTDRYSIENVRRISDVVKKIVLDSTASGTTHSSEGILASVLSELSEVLLHSLNESSKPSSAAEESEHTGLFE